MKNSRENENGIFTADFFGEFRLEGIWTEAFKNVGDIFFGYIKHGSRTPSNDPAADLDDRYFEHSPVKHSPYFKRLRSARRNNEVYTEYGLYPERFCAEHPIPFGSREEYSEATLEICDDYKRISMSCGVEIVIFPEEGTVMLRNVDRYNPEFLVATDNFLDVTDIPFCDFLISKGIEPQIISKTVKVTDYCDAISENGGTFSMGYEVIMESMTVEQINFELKLFGICKDENGQRLLSDSENAVE